MGIKNVFRLCTGVGLVVTLAACSTGMGLHSDGADYFHRDLDSYYVHEISEEKYLSSASASALVKNKEKLDSYTKEEIVPNVGDSFPNYLPLDKGVVTSLVGYRNISIGSRYHKGTDIAGVPVGTPVYAAGSGEVVHVVRVDKDGYGLQVLIDHGSNIFTRYAHLHPGTIPNTVQEGSKVVKGQRIGGIGNTGTSTGPHLHFEILVKQAGGYMQPQLPNSFIPEFKDLNREQVRFERWKGLIR